MVTTNQAYALLRQNKNGLLWAIIFLPMVGLLNHALFGFGSVNPIEAITATLNQSLRPYYLISLLISFIGTGVIWLVIQNNKKRVVGIYAFLVIMVTIFIGGLSVITFSFLSGISLTKLQSLALLLIDGSLPSNLKNLYLGCLLGSAAIVLFPIVGALLRGRVNVLGDAHFASLFEIARAGFFKDPKGLILGKKAGLTLTAEGYEHVLVFSPAGSGKTTAIAMPNLLHWQDSCVVNDTKYELFEKTSGYRQNSLKNDVFLWAPLRKDGKTHRYNPLHFISQDKHRRISEIQMMSHILIPNGNGEPIWYQGARELFLALTLYMLDTKDTPTTFAEMYRLSKTLGFINWLKSVVTNVKGLDPEFYRNAAGFLNAPDKTGTSILKTFTGYLEIFANPIINAATSGSDFNLQDLRKKKMTVYVGFADNEKAIISPLITIFWQQLISFMTETLPDKTKEPFDVLCLMDEFSALGRLNNLKDSLKILRGYRVRVMIIIQYLAQTLEVYSRAEAEAFKNIKTKVSFALDSQEDAEYVSKLLGMRTKRIRNTSTSNNGHSSSYHHQPVPLMRPEEIQRLKEGKAIILRTGRSPALIEQCRWYKDKELKTRPCGESYIPTQKPFIIPYETEERLDDDLSMDDFQKNNEKKSQLELDKARVQAELISDIVRETVMELKQEE
jgi:type IV secretion system protein VirD4